MLLKAIAAPALDQRLGFGMVAQFVRQQQRGDGFGQPGDMLGDVDQRHREVARGAQNGKSQCADQHDIAGGGAAALPQHDGPGQQRDRQQDSNTGMQRSAAFRDSAGCVPAP